MELKDTLLADNLRYVTGSLVKCTETYTPLPTSKRSVTASTPITPSVSTTESKASVRTNKRKAWYERSVDVHIVEEARVILKSFQHGNQVRIHPHVEKPYGVNKGNGANRLPTLLPGDTILDADKHPAPDAYDGGLRERILADSKRMYNQHQARKVKSKGSKNKIGWQYRLPGHDVKGKSY